MYKITNWNATPSKLQIVVGVEPLDMVKKYMWAFHGTNQYDQDMRWSWWHINIDDDPTCEVFGEEGRELLCGLVRAHNELRLLADHYNLPLGVG